MTATAKVAALLGPFFVSVQGEISLPTLQRLLGHEHLSTTQVCLNLWPVISEFHRKW